jgi:hypothetical protein
LIHTTGKSKKKKKKLSFQSSTSWNFRP